MRRVIAAAAAAALLAGCGSDTRSGTADAGRDAAAVVGLACHPEHLDVALSPTEIYEESLNSECGGETCVVYRVDGDTRRDCTSGCATEEQFAERVFCSCVCRAPMGEDAGTLCACPDGTVCEEGSIFAPGFCIREELIP